MLKKTIKYTDWDGAEIEEDFYFNLTKAEIIELNLDAGKDGLEALITKLIKESDSVRIYGIFKDIILTAYGKRVEIDGVKRFVKNDNYRDEFVQTGAFSELVMDMLQNPRHAAEFITGCLPQDIVKASKAEIDKVTAQIDAATE
jgi:hypothetical protein